MKFNFAGWNTPAKPQRGGNWGKVICPSLNKTMQSVIWKGEQRNVMAST